MRPEPARGAVLGNFLEQIVVRVEEKRKPRREFIHGQSRGDRGIDVGDRVGQREGDFLRRRRARFPNVIPGNGDHVPGGELGAAPREEVGDDAHRRARRIDVRAARDEFLQDIVLNRSGNFPQVRALLLSDSGVKHEKNRGSRVDRHGRRYAVQGNAVEERLHVFERIDGDADFSHFAGGAGMVRIVADLRRQIECNGQPRLPFSEQVAKAFVGLSCRAKSGVLAHGPQTPAVHRGVNAARVGKFSGDADRGFDVLPGKVFLRVDGFQGNAAERREALLSFARCGRLFGRLIGRWGHRTRRESRKDNTPKRIIRSE